MNPMMLLASMLLLSGCAQVFVEEPSLPPQVAPVENATLPAEETNIPHATLQKADVKGFFEQEANITKVAFVPHYLRITQDGKIIIENTLEPEKIVVLRLRKGQSPKELYTSVLNTGEPFTFQFKTPGKYHVLCVNRGCSLSVEVAPS